MNMDKASLIRTIREEYNKLIHDLTNKGAINFNKDKLAQIRNLHDKYNKLIYQVKLEIA